MYLKCGMEHLLTIFILYCTEIILFLFAYFHFSLLHFLFFI